MRPSTVTWQAANLSTLLLLAALCSTAGRPNHHWPSDSDGAPQRNADVETTNEYVTGQGIVYSEAADRTGDLRSHPSRLLQQEYGMQRAEAQQLGLITSPYYYKFGNLRKLHEDAATPTAQEASAAAASAPAASAPAASSPAASAPAASAPAASAPATTAPAEPACHVEYRSHAWKHKWRLNHRADWNPNQLIKTGNITIGTVTPQWISWHLDNSKHTCVLGDVDIHCKFQKMEMSSDAAKAADALFYHIPQYQGEAIRHRDDQVLIAGSCEPSAYYGRLSNTDYMANFEIDATYRTCAAARFSFIPFNTGGVEALFEPPLPFNDKKNAIAYLNRNCMTRSDRANIVRQMMALGNTQVPVHSFGCDANQNNTWVEDKIALFRQYKFCITMENSLVKDYMSEKTWNGFMAGCVPIMLGPTNIENFLPEPNAVIDFSKFGTVDKLYEEIIRLANNETAYNEKMAWKNKCLEDFSPGFQQAIRVGGADYSCMICRAVYQHKVQGVRFTTCMKNETWTSTFQPL